MSVYKIVEKGLDEALYVGSTGKKLSRRRNVHVQHARTNDSKFYKYIREHGGMDNFELVVIEECPNLTKDELRQREEYYRKKLNPPLNTYRAFTTAEELKQQMNRNLEPLLCECGITSSKLNIKRHKQNRLHKQTMSLPFLKASLGRAAFLKKLAETK